LDQSDESKAVHRLSELSFVTPLQNTAAGPLQSTSMSDTLLPRWLSLQ